MARVAMLLSLVLSGTAYAETLNWSFEGYPEFNALLTSGEVDPIIYTEDRAPEYLLTRIVVEGASAAEWTEAVEILNTSRRNEPKDAGKWYERFREHGEATCPSEWQVIAQDKKSLTFERRSGACMGHAPQQALYRVLYGKREVFTLIATRKGGMDDATRQAWLTVLGSAGLK